MKHLNAKRSGDGQPSEPASFEANPNSLDQLASGTSDSPIDKSTPAVLSLRAPWDPLYYDERKFIAIPSDQPSATVGEHLPFWMGRLLTMGPFNAESLKAGAAMWDKLSLNVPRELSEGLLHVKNLDDDTARAAHSAMLATCNSSLNPSDVEAAAYTLSVFLNTHPAFHHMAAADEYINPFGENTAYELVTLGIPQD